MPVTADDVNQMLGGFSALSHRCMELSERHAVARILVTDSELRPGNLISGPTQFRLADAALWYLVFGAIGRIEPMAVTSELSIRFLRPAQGTHAVGPGHARCLWSPQRGGHRPTVGRRPGGSTGVGGAGHLRAPTAADARPA
jgi:acyl-coenzyme A thioesterase PaaI-like protein